MKHRSKLDSTLPDSLRDEAELEELLSRPTPEVVAAIGKLKGRLLILGAGGKMGPTLARMARRAVDLGPNPKGLEVAAVSRFSNRALRTQLEKQGVRTIQCDLLDRKAVARLPDAQNILYLLGVKFGTQGDPSRTWATNTLAPLLVAEHFPRTTLVLLSSANVYPASPVKSGGSVESDPLNPVGEYPNSCVARERIFQYLAGQHGQKMAFLRLSYALDLRYGVYADIVESVLHGHPVSLANSHVNCIWQGDACAMTLRSFALAQNPPAVFNLTSPRSRSVKQIAIAAAKLLKRKPKFTGQPGPVAFVSNPARLCRLLGPPPTPLPTVLRWTALWLSNGGNRWIKPTGFAVRDGDY